MVKLFLLLSFFTTINTSISIDEMRMSILEVSTIKEADTYIQLLEDSKIPEAPAYAAGLILMKAKFAFFPFNKWNYFKNGSSLLDTAILEKPQNIEMRYIRFLFQSEIPNFLGYHKNLREDYNLIINNIINCSLPLKFKQSMLNKMLLVKGITARQTIEINKIIQKI